jgi:hypothetical protein
VISAGRGIGEQVVKPAAADADARSEAGRSEVAGKTLEATQTLSGPVAGIGFCLRELVERSAMSREL